MEFEGVFCPNCGTRCEEEDVVQAKKDGVDKKIQTEMYSKPAQTMQNSVVDMVNTQKQKKIFAILALVFGILSICTFGLFFIPDVLAIVFGILSLKSEDSKGLAVGGIICGVITLLIFVIFFVAIMVS